MMPYMMNDTVGTITSMVKMPTSLSHIADTPNIQLTGKAVVALLLAGSSIKNSASTISTSLQPLCWLILVAILQEWSQILLGTTRVWRHSIVLGLISKVVLMHFVLFNHHFSFYFLLSRRRQQRGGLACHQPTARGAPSTFDRLPFWLR